MPIHINLYTIYTIDLFSLLNIEQLTTSVLGDNPLFEINIDF